jgi:hypothetical protein
LGGEPYYYYVPYNPDIQAALDDLRKREFKAGRYFPATSMEFPLTQDSPAPGAQHSSIEEALSDAGESGTYSILDISQVGPRPDLFTAGPLSKTELVELFGTDQPGRVRVEEAFDLWDKIDRGHCVYVICYTDGMPDGIYFGGYSFD